MMTNTKSRRFNIAACLKTHVRFCSDQSHNKMNVGIFDVLPDDILPQLFDLHNGNFSKRVYELVILYKTSINLGCSRYRTSAKVRDILSRMPLLKELSVNSMFFSELDDDAADLFHEYFEEYGDTLGTLSHEGLLRLEVACCNMWKSIAPDFCLPRLQYLGLDDCTCLEDIDALDTLSELTHLRISGVHVFI